MSPSDRCDEVIRLIDEALDEGLGAGSDEDAPAEGEGASEGRPEGDGDDDVESVPGQWGVYYLRPGV